MATIASQPEKGATPYQHSSSNTQPEASSSSQRPIQQDEILHNPPPYSGPATPGPSNPPTLQSQLSSPPSQPPQITLGIPRLDYRLYNPQSFTLSENQTTITSNDRQLNTERTSLLNLIQRLSSIPPKPEIRIVGKSNGTESVDFDLRCNMMRLLAPDGEKERMNYIHTMPQGEVGWRGRSKKSVEPGLEGVESWIRCFCEDDSMAKEFVLERCIINWDTTHLENNLYLLFRSIGYAGRVTVSFPATHTKVLICPEDKRPRFISSISKVFSSGPHKYETVKSIWPYANVPRGEPGRKCAVQTEDEWFREWKGAIAHAALQKRKKVWVTVEDQLEVLMAPKRGIEDREQGDLEWGSSLLDDDRYRHGGTGYYGV